MYQEECARSASGGGAKLLLRLIHVAGRAKRRTVSILIDTFLVAFFLGTLIPGWIFMADDYSWRNSSGTAIVGTYGTMGMIVNMFVSPSSPSPQQLF